MKGKHINKLIAGVMGAAMTLTATAAAVHAVAPADVQLTNNKVSASAEGKVVFDLGFESEDDLANWSNRGGDDTTKVSISADAAKSGKSGLLASGRSESWNGPAFRLDGVLEPNKQYYLSASVKGKYYTSAMLSFQSTADGVTSYSNLVQNLNGSDWATVKDVPISYSDGMEGVYVYFEGGSDDLYIDDFKIVEAPHIDIEKDLPSLSELYKDQFKIGTALTPDDLASQPFMDLVQKHFGESITVGNQMKPDYVLNKDATLKYFEETGDDETPQISFAQAKPVLNYARKYGIPVRVHTLVWHSQTPEWFFKEDFDEKKDYVSPEKMKARMKNYIKSYFETLTKLYPDIDFYACDVVNEAWTDDGKPREAGHCAQSNNYAASDWVAVFGDNSFIDYAFEYAREYAPKGCKLYYNDFNEYMTGKMNAVIEMAERIKKAGNIDGIGMQSHLDVRESLQAAFPSLSMYETALKNYTGLGLDVQITELDATVQDRSGDKYFDVQGDYYKGLFKLYEKYADKISAVIFWGVTDTKSWRAPQNPLIFDKDYMAKPAFKAIVGDRTAADPVRTTIADGGKVTTTTTTTTTTSVTTSAQTTTSVGEEVKVTKFGDANNDSQIDMGDVVIIMQALANPNKYGIDGTDEHAITKQGWANADIAGTSKGVTNDDALAIQEYLLGKRNLEGGLDGLQEVGGNASK
ncbi:endo-1,4-beta-xylanase [Ruminococcus flavefaciens]|uniref:Beta-xylanase n=1 Tax=Ruminococcus flavefaciens TaxID=1265 RepID=A0A1H6KRJ7_RUMFL|nr:endo-1,4-beta-xylanase [Ruminococcus flavefaciens]SEH78132.1 endo-1,4-beta-xylanase [Ruminococcus flavefaciens]